MFVLGSAISLVLATAAPPSATQLVERVQRYYDQTKGFSADFIQIYTRVALSKSYESRGTVTIEKPGLMRWEYRKPAEKLVIADGRRLYNYDPEEQQVKVDEHFEVSELSSSIGFLWGSGRLKDSFTVKPSDEKPSAPNLKARALELIPRSDASFARLILIVDGGTGQVIESVIHETTGNTNHFIFSNVKVNPKLPPDLFKFTPPPGVEVVPVSH